MRVSRSAALLSALLTGPAVVDAAGNLNCEQIRDGGVGWNLGKLDRVHTVHHLERTETDEIRNLTFEINICKPLKRNGKPCPQGSRICAFEKFKRDNENWDDVKLTNGWPVAGDYPTSNGRSLNAQPKRLKDSDSEADSNKEGLRLSLEGGMRGQGDNAVKVKAIIDFICRPKWTGNELPDDNNKKRYNDGDPLPNPDKGQALQYTSYRPGRVNKENVMILRLSWKTKYACEGPKDNDGDGGDEADDKSGGWGFFTWFIIILFLAVSAYLIFGSWLNYNRYGARGWDLLPHGDTIRDVPYLLKEWGRKVVSGGGSRDLGNIRV